MARRSWHIRRLLPWMCLLVLLAARAFDAFPTSDCRRSNCEFAVKEECQHSERVYCNLARQSNQKITITRTSFPKHVREITISNVQGIDIEADAIASLASLEAIELTNIGILTLLPRSLARTNQSGRMSLTIQHVKSIQLHPEIFADWRNSRSKITIEDVNQCHMSPKTIAPSTRIRSLQLVRIANLTIDRDAFAAESAVDDMWLSDIAYLTVETGAFAPNTAVQVMRLEDIESLTLHAGAFAPNSYIRKAVISRITSLLIDSGGIQANISVLTFSHVAMNTCANNTFGSTIQTMSLANSHIKLMKSGCISSSGVLKNVLVENSRFDHIDSLALRGTIDEVQIKDSRIGSVETEGFSLNVTRFTVERSNMSDLSKQALAVFAAEVITLKNCTVTVLRKHAFSLLQLDPGAKEPVRMEYLHIEQPGNKSLQFASGTNVVVSHLNLDIPCSCDMIEVALQLGLPTRLHPADGNDPKLSGWFEQTRCVTKTATPTMAEYDQKYCAGTVPIPRQKTTTITNHHKQQQQAEGRPPSSMSAADAHGSAGSGQTCTDTFNTWYWSGFWIGALAMFLAVAALEVLWWARCHRSLADTCGRRVRKIYRLKSRDRVRSPSLTEWQISSRSTSPSMSPRPSRSTKPSRSPRPSRSPSPSGSDRGSHRASLISEEGLFGGLTQFGVVRDRELQFLSEPLLLD